MGKLTKKKTLKSRKPLKKPLKKSLKSRKTLKKKVGGGWFSNPFSKKVTRYGTGSSLTPNIFSNMRSSVNRARGITTYADEFGNIQRATRKMRGKKNALAFWRGRNFDEAVRYQSHSMNRLKGMQRRVDSALGDIRGKIEIKRFKYNSILQLPSSDPKRQKLMTKLGCTDNPTSCMTKIESKLNAKAQKYAKKLRMDAMQSKLTKRLNKFNKMESKVGKLINKKVLSTNRAVLIGSIKKCKQKAKMDPSFSSGDCIEKVSNLFKDITPGKPISVQDIKTVTGIQLSRDDIFKANKGYIFSASAKRRANRAVDDRQIKQLQSYHENKDQVLKRVHTTQSDVSRYTTSRQQYPPPVLASSPGTPQVVSTQSRVAQRVGQASVPATPSVSQKVRQGLLEGASFV
jgi:hypothetical protein